MNVFVSTTRLLHYQESEPEAMRIESIDHLVLTVADIETTIDFYTRVLGMESVEFGEGRRALKFGNQKINLHEAAKEIAPHARIPEPGSADLCLLTTSSIDDVITILENSEITIELGPVQRTGAMGAIDSVYIRDPDGNLLEISNYKTAN